MSRQPFAPTAFSSRHIIWLGLLAALAGCASGPNYQTPAHAASPAGWEQRPSSTPELSHNVAVDTQALPQQWWTVFNDTVLTTLERKLVDGNIDLQTYALRFSQSRLQQAVIASQSGPQVSATAQVTRQRESENSAETRLINAIATNNAQKQKLISLLSTPFTQYQAGFDASWELDLWGRVARSVESAKASADAAAAMLKQAHLSLSGELAQAYFQLRQAQQQQQLLQQQIALTRQLLKLNEVQAANGLISEDRLITLHNQLADQQARLSPLQAQTGQLSNRLTLLTGGLPGDLNTLLAPRPADTAPSALPDLRLGIPSELVRRRPDIQAAEAQLHAATADIGVAVAELYPRISLGASLGYQSISQSKFGDWGSRTWQVGPVLSLPIFDQGRRRATIQLRKQEQQQAAIAYQHSVLKAWQEVDDALTSYAGEQQRNQQLHNMLSRQQQLWQLANARYRNGLVNQQDTLQAEQQVIRAQSDLADSNQHLQTDLVAIYKAVGGGDIPVKIE